MRSNWTLAQVEEAVPEGHRATVRRWLARGDGVAVYENHDFGHPDLGRKIFVSFGSEAAQLPGNAPPLRLPDFPQQINWRYVLVGTYRPARQEV